MLALYGSPNTPTNVAMYVKLTQVDPWSCAPPLTTVRPSSRALVPSKKTPSSTRGTFSRALSLRARTMRPSSASSPPLKSFPFERNAEYPLSSVSSDPQAHTPQLDDLVTKVSVALCRYSDLLPADKIFFDAGEASKAAGRLNMAFVFWNRFIDLCDAIEDADPSALEPGDWVQTDIPSDVPLPPKSSIPERAREQVREWVLAVSMDQKVDPPPPNARDRADATG